MGTVSPNRPLAAVTGASSGIGLELAKQFAEHGFDLVVCAEDEGILGAATDIARLGVSVEAVKADLATYAGVETFCAELVSVGRPLDAIAINAGVGVGGDFARETALAEELNVIALNVVSTVHLSKRVLKDMVARGSGRILFTSSIAATMPTPLEAVYGASKAFVQSFADSIRHELKDTGVTVTCLVPGPTNTNFFHRAGLDDTKVGTEEKNKNRPEDVARQGFEALMAGDARVVGATSLMTKLQGTLGKLPDDIEAVQHRKMAEHGLAKR
ncbi:MAG: SDR family NAD(P)-dependent oxidoreductase [Myxococcota bacterium]|nr:SDR family NAD(P)-dependent oxidoreductase [Myxococcota bacterium]